MDIFNASKKFPREEMYSLTDQIRRASRSVCGNLGEAWRKRRYEAAFISKLSDAEAEAAEVQVWIQFAVKCGYLERSAGEAFYKSYDSVLRMLVAMINAPASWVIAPTREFFFSLSPGSLVSLSGELPLHTLAGLFHFGQFDRARPWLAAEDAFIVDGQGVQAVAERADAPLFVAVLDQQGGEVIDALEHPRL